MIELTKEDALQLQKKIDECHINGDCELYDIEYFLKVDVRWGDWKHDHIALRMVAEELGYKEWGNEVTEEDGSDCYSAIHYFAKMAE